MSDWFVVFYEQERQRFINWCNRAKVELEKYGCTNVSYQLIWVPGSGPSGVALFRAYCPLQAKTIERYIDTVLAYSFGDDWYRFCYWFVGYVPCKQEEREVPTQPGQERSPIASVLEFEGQRRYVDLVKAHYTAVAVGVALGVYHA
jgi:hypothetical protein